MQDLVRINSDDWEDAGKMYIVHSAYRRPGSTAVELELEHNGIKTKRVVAYHMLEWIYG